MTSFFAFLSVDRVANNRQQTAIVVCTPPTIAARCVTSRCISSVTGYATERDFIGINLVCQAQPISVRLPSAEKMCGSPNRQKKKQLKSSTRS